MPSRTMSEPHSIPFTLSGIALVVLLLGLAAATAFFQFVDRTGSTNAAGDASTSGALVGRQLTIPTSWLRDMDGRDSGDFASEIELVLRLPLGKNGAMLPIHVTLLPLSQARPSAELLDGVYLHQFMPSEFSGPPGLVGKPLYADAGFANETVWYDALSQAPFVAKCMAPIGGAATGSCLRTVALPGGIAAIFRFDSDALYAWKDFDRLVDQPLRQIGALSQVG